MSVFKSFWAELNTPTEYHDDPYGGLTNQIGHVAAGALFAGLICLIYGYVFDEMPYKGAVIVVMVLLYGGVIEWRVQRSSFVDGIQDTSFVMMGVCLVIFSFTEHPHDGDFVLLKLESSPAVAWLGCIVVGLIAYVTPRAIRKYRNPD